ncbi:MAG: LysM peptidoglycan-binding domain-containing protein [Pelobium sp.]
MKFKSLLFISILFFSIKTYANTLKDSIGVENLNGKKIILHKVEAKETYYSLGRKYKITPQIIMEFNKNIGLQPNDVVKIPTQQNFESAKPVSFSSPQKNTNLPKETTHTVKPGETLYAIASQYNMRIDDLKLLNKLNSSSLSVGQILKVIDNESVSLNPELQTNANGKPVLVKEIPKAVENITPPVQAKIKYLDSTDSQNGLEIPKNRYGITEMNDKGLAVWIDDNNLDPNKSYALHRTAPVGTIIKITNPMTNRSVFAKVVGRFTENATTKDVIIVLTKATADAIGALDKRFIVNITFGIPNNEQQ